MAGRATGVVRIAGIRSLIWILQSLPPQPWPAAPASPPYPRRDKRFAGDFGRYAGLCKPQIPELMIVCAAGSGRLESFQLDDSAAQSDSNCLSPIACA